MHILYTKYIRLLQEAGCIFVDENGKVESQTLGRIASFYYLKYQTLTVFTTYLQPAMTVQDVSHFSPIKQCSHNAAVRLIFSKC